MKKILLEAICIVQGSMDCGIIADRIHDPVNKIYTRGIVTYSKKLGEQLSAEKKMPSFYMSEKNFAGIWNSEQVTFNIEYIMPTEEKPTSPVCESKTYNIYLNGELVEY